MLGAIIGDIAGSRFEFANTNRYGFKLFTDECSFTDDSICTFAVADAAMNGGDYVESILDWCTRHKDPMGGYGARFSHWLRNPDHEPYGSYGNGSAMRVSPVAWVFDNEQDVLRHALMSASVTHNHPEGLIGAASVALAIFALRKKEQNGLTVESIVRHAYGEDWEGKIIPKNVFDETCQGCVPLAFHLLKLSTSFEDAIRKAVSYGGDSDTLAAIVGSMAEAKFGIPEEIAAEAYEYLPERMQRFVRSFRRRYVK